MEILRKSLLILVVVSSASCVTNTPPICHNTAHLSRGDYDIPIFDIRQGVNDKEYRSGSVFGYEWVKRGSFTYTGECDKLAYKVTQ
ncbi:phage exclusion lipoprotein Cor [Erwinia rhapontici]|uniref:phage exclusion lipoprotein Cor n=1 Tax=Erwinia rhapontici TaxID=55212 RepID=UPI0013316233|nr:hypothetical protein [Erwinia rhapontici]MBP2157112.1 hypothetical protein [Erwinia rhapontici]